MTGLRRIFAGTICALLATTAAAPVDAQTAATAPSGSATDASVKASSALDVSELDRALMMQMARRSLTFGWTGRPPPAVNYEPPTLAALEAHVHVTIRWRGTILGDAQSTRTRLLPAVVSAATTAAHAALLQVERPDEKLLESAIEIEVIGATEYVRAGLDSDARHEALLYASFEPGVDGVGVEYRGRVGRVRPSQIIAANYTPNLALGHAEQLAGVTKEEKQLHANDLRYFRFHTLHFWQPSAHGPVTTLRRGMTLVPPSAVSVSNVDESIRELAQYVMKRRRRDAWFAYEYTPVKQWYTEYNELFGQFEAAYNLGQFGRIVGSKECEVSAARVIAAGESFLVAFRGDLPLRAAINTKEAPPLATTGAYLAAMSSLKWPEYTIDPVHIADAIRVVQDASGRFDVVFPPDPPIAGKAWAAGAAIVGLLEFGADHNNPDADRAIRQAVRFYDRYFDSAPDLRLASWMSRAMAISYERKPDPPVSDLLFRLADWLAAHQITESMTSSSDMHGAFVTPEESTPDAISARCALAIADAHRIAVRVGDRERAARYRNVMLRATRFLMQLQFRAEECYYIGQPLDVVDGTRLALWDNRIDVSHCAASLLALARMREELFGAAPQFEWREPAVPAATQPVPTPEKRTITP